MNRSEAGSSVIGIGNIDSGLDVEICIRFSDNDSGGNLNEEMK